LKSQRYIRQTTLKAFGPESQQKLSEAKVLVVGLGGLGIPVLQYLNAMGVGTLGMVEQDVVELTNLQRQVLYSEDDIGNSKLVTALAKLQAQNSNTHFIPFDTFLTRENALDILKEFDLIVDASDNFPTRYLVNDACVILNKPFIYGALHGFEGQVSVFNHEGGPTYRCLFPTMPAATEIPNCNDNGVLGVLPGIVGNLQALEAIKVISGIGEVLSGQLLLFDALSNTFQKIRFQERPEHKDITKLQVQYENSCTTAIKTISITALQELRSWDTHQLIDVRTTAEYANYHLPNSKNIPLDNMDVRTSEIALEKPVYLLCQSGKRSALACEQLQQKFPNAEFISVLGGLNAYTAQYS